MISQLSPNPPFKRFAFSTLGCPGSGIDEVLKWCREFDVSGLELRCGSGEIADVSTTNAQRAALRSRLEHAGVTVLAVGSYVQVCGPDSSSSSLAQLAEVIGLAADLGAAGVRVFPGWDGMNPPTPKQADNKAVELLACGAALASRRGVRLFLETHDSHPRGQDIARILGRLDEVSPGHGVLAIWDLLHPWRHGENVRATCQTLLPWLGYLQIKDATLVDGGPEVSLTLPGAGDIPLQEAVKLIRGQPILALDDHWVSLEWEKAWHPTLPPLNKALSASNALVQ